MNHALEFVRPGGIAEQPGKSGLHFKAGLSQRLTRLLYNSARKLFFAVAGLESSQSGLVPHTSHVPQVPILRFSPKYAQMWACRHREESM